MVQNPRAALALRLGGFGVSLGFSTLVSLLGIPFVMLNLGANAWAGLALILSTAAIFGVAVAFGWGTIGAAMTASTPFAERPMMYANSLISRLYLFALAIIPMIVVSIMLSRVGVAAAVIGSFAYLLPFLGASWYFIGQSKPSRLFLFDVFPQGMGIVTGVLATMVFPHAWVYVTCQLVCNLWAVVGSAVVIMRRDAEQPLRPVLRPGPALRRLKSQWEGVVAAGTGTINSNVPMVAVSILAGPALPVYALAEKLFRYGVAGFGPVLQVIQGWIPEAGESHKNVRVQRAARIAPLFGLAGGAFLALLTPWAGRLLSTGQVSVGWDLAIPFGVIFCGVVVAQVVGLACLIPIGKGSELAKSTSIGAGVNIVGMIGLGLLFGAVGIAWSVAVSELCVAVYQLNVVRRYFASGGTNPGDADEHR